MEIKKVKKIIKYILIPLVLIISLVLLNDYLSYSRRIGTTSFYLVETMAISKSGKPLTGLYYKPADASGYKGVEMPGFPVEILWNERFLVSKNFDGDSILINCYVVIDVDSINKADGIMRSIHKFRTVSDYNDYLKQIGISESDMHRTSNHIKWWE